MKYSFLLCIIIIKFFPQGDILLTLETDINGIRVKIDDGSEIKLPKKVFLSKGIHTIKFITSSGYEVIKHNFQKNEK